MLRDGGGWPWFVAGVLLGVGLPLSLRASSVATAVVGVLAVVAGGWLLRSSPRIVSVFDARIGSVVVARRPVLGRRSTVRLPLPDIDGVSVVGGRRHR